MAQPQQDVIAEMLFPLGGIDSTAEFELQPPGTALDGVNVRAFENLTNSARGGSRPGLSKWIEEGLPIEEGLA